MWTHSSEEPEQQERALGTILAPVAPDRPPMAYTITLGYRPGYDDVWHDGTETVVDRESPAAVVYLIRHALGVDPLGEGPQATDSVRVWIPLDYDGDEFPGVGDVDGCEWEALLGEAGFRFTDFNRSRVPFSEWAHRVSAMLMAAGVDR